MAVEGRARDGRMRGWRAVGSAGAAALLIAGAVGITSAAVSAQDETIDACVHRVTGQVRIDDTCRKREQPLSWPATSGEQNTYLALTSVAVTRTITVPPASDPTVDPVVDVSVRCPDGMVPVAGGYPLGYSPAEVKLEQWYSAPDHYGRYWRTGWVNRTDRPVTATIGFSAFCTPGIATNDWDR